MDESPPEGSKLHIKIAGGAGKPLLLLLFCLDIARKIALRQSAEKVIRLDRVLFGSMEA